MADQYIVVLEFSRPPSDIQRMASVAREAAAKTLPDQEKADLLYTASVMYEIAEKMEE